MSTPAQRARRLAAELALGPLAARGLTLGPLASRAGFRGGPQAAPHAPDAARFALAEQLALGAAAALHDAADTRATRLDVALPMQREIKAWATQLEPLALSVLTALTLRAALAEPGLDAAALTTQLNKAASDHAPATYAVAQVQAALDTLRALALVECVAGRWTKRTEH